MWLQQVITALLAWLEGLVSKQLHKTGEDVPTQPELAGRLNDRLAAWKKKAGAP